MGYILCTAEKPSVAGDIAKVLGANTKRNGYFEGNGYRVTWAVGHLVGLAEPHLYGYMSLEDLWDKEKPQNKEIALEQLPLIPNQFKLVVLENTKEQFEIMKSLMLDDECDSIIDCGDSGAEGHILQWFIRVKAGCKKPIRRFIAQSMTEEAIKEAMNNLQDINKYTSVIIGEFCKKKADWIMGMSMSRCASIIYNAKVDVGRVQSPTLYFIVKRYIEVIGFKVKDYYGFKADFKKGFSLYWNKDSQNLLPIEAKDSENRLLDKQVAQCKADEIKGANKGKITALETKNRATDRPQLYDITELERDGNIIYGYTAEQVLQTAQSLYETHKITTYPRTDSRYITTDLVPYLKPRLQDIATHSKYTDICNELLNGELNIDKKLVDDEQVTDHHAIIVTPKLANYDLEKLNKMERDILDLIITRILVALSDKYKYRETVVNVTFPNGMVFTANGKIPVSEGWKRVQKSLMGKNIEEDTPKEEVEQEFKNITLGEEVELDNILVVTKKTTPPKLHTEATLLTAMENAGALVEGGAILKGKGIGTQATRANIIKQLFDKGYVKNQTKGKTNYLIPTKQGMSVIKVLPAELYSPKITADWENQIAEIVSGRLTEKEFMDNFERFIREKLIQIRNNKIENVDFSFDKDVVGKCLWCKSDVCMGEFKDKDGKKVESMYCTNKECKFSIRKDNLIFKLRTGKNLTAQQMKKLLTNGSIEVKCVSKTNVAYTGIFSVKKNDKGYADIVCDLPQKSKGNSKMGTKNSFGSSGFGKSKF